MNTKINNFNNLIEKSKELSKEKFISFAKNIFHTDTNLWNHLRNTPIISNLQSKDIISTTLSTKNEKEIHSILDTCIEDELGDSEAAFIPFEKLAIEFSDEEINEYKNSIINENYNAFIVYNEYKIKNHLKELIEENNKKVNKKSENELDNLFINYTSEIFTHEICHLNANILACDTKNSDLDELVNGSELSQSNIDDNVALSDFYKWSNRNEVLIDTLSKMIHNYQNGDTIEDCLYKIVKERNGKSQYNDFDDSTILSLYIIFPEQLTEWAMFGAYNDVHINLLEQKFNEVFSTKSELNNSQMLTEAKNYFNQMNYTNLSDKQIELRKNMLEMLEPKKYEKQINLQDIKKVATSEIAMSQLEECFISVKSTMQTLLKETQEIEILEK